MQADAIQRVSNAIHDVLASALTAANVSGGVFIGPLDDSNASGAALVMFLFRIAPTPDLRSSDHVTVSNDPVPVPVTYRNSLPVDLYYLVAAGDQKVGGEAESLYWIGLALQTLQAQGELTGSVVDGETVRLTLDPISNEEMGRVWTLFPTENYRTSVIYIASPVWIDPAAALSAAPLVKIYRTAPPPSN
jgi:Pvc16 N-terminal domain